MWLMVSKRGLWLLHFKPNGGCLASAIFTRRRIALAGARKNGIVYRSE